MIKILSMLGIFSMITIFIIGIDMSIFGFKICKWMKEQILNQNK